MAVIEEMHGEKEEDGGDVLVGEEETGAPAADADGLEGFVEPEFDLLKAQEAKALGNTHYAAGEWQLASDAYTEAIMWAPPDVEVRRSARIVCTSWAHPRSLRTPSASRRFANHLARAGESCVPLQPCCVLCEDGPVGSCRRRLHIRAGDPAAIC